MKRIRKNGGARDILSPLRIAVLWGQKDKDIILALGLGPVARNEFISVTPEDEDEYLILKNAGHLE